MIARFHHLGLSTQLVIVLGALYAVAFIVIEIIDRRRKRQREEGYILKGIDILRRDEEFRKRTRDMYTRKDPK